MRCVFMSVHQRSDDQPACNPTSSNVAATRQCPGRSCPGVGKVAQASCLWKWSRHLACESATCILPVKVGGTPRYQSPSSSPEVPVTQFKSLQLRTGRMRSVLTGAGKQDEEKQAWSHQLGDLRFLLFHQNMEKHRGSRMRIVKRHR